MRTLVAFWMTVLVSSGLGCQKSAQDSSPPAKPPEVLQPAETAKLEPVKSNSDWDAAVQTIWESELGQTFSAYLKSGLKSAELNSAVNAVTDRVFKDADHEILRIAALQALISDLYEHGKYDQNTSDKVSILEVDITRRALAISKVPEASAVSALPYLLFLSFVGGSPVVQSQLRKTADHLYDALYAYSFGAGGYNFKRIYRDVDMSRVFSKEFFVGYSPLSAATSFVSVFPPGLSLYYLLFSRNPELIGDKLNNQISRYRKEGLSDLSEL